MEEKNQKTDDTARHPNMDWTLTCYNNNNSDNNNIIIIIILQIISSSHVYVALTLNHNVGLTNTATEQGEWRQKQWRQRYLNVHLPSENILSWVSVVRDFTPTSVSFSSDFPTDAVPCSAQEFGHPRWRQPGFPQAYPLTNTQLSVLTLSCSVVELDWNGQVYALAAPDKLRMLHWRAAD